MNIKGYRIKRTPSGLLESMKRLESSGVLSRPPTSAAVVSAYVREEAEREELIAMALRHLRDTTNSTEVFERCKKALGEQ